MNISTIYVFAIMTSLTISTLALANFMLMFGQSVYAVDNCVAAQCQNIETGTANSQNNDCISVGVLGCRNFADGNDNTQTNRCRSVGVECGNGATGNENTQLNNCSSVGGGEFAGTCSNGLNGNDNSQNTECHSVGFLCQNIANGNGNTQNILCARMQVCNNNIASSV